MIKSLVNKIAIIISGTGGLGYAYVKGFMKDGFDVLKILGLLIVICFIAILLK